ncbi:MAG: hypothetical protein KGI49_03200 [Patescibacteria group bacterium]|nr:hypothetical protein [Patescibacteria group bacterium]
MNIISALFGSEARVKMLRLFLFNPESVFASADISKRTQCSSAAVRKEIAALIRAGVIKKGKSGAGYMLESRFPYLESLKNLLTVASVSADQTLVKRFAKAGKIKVLMAAGVFIQNWDSRVDLLIVGDDLSQARIEAAIRDIEAEIGKEIAYSLFETQDFEYRLGMHDRLIRDIIDYPHVTLIDRLGVVPE